MNDQDRAALEAWKEGSDPDARTFEDAFNAGLAHARKTKEEQEMTELQALRVIALAVGPAALEKSGAEMLALDKKWHQACLDESHTSHADEKRAVASKASLDALYQAMH